MRSGLMWLVVVLAIAGAWFLFNPSDTGEDPIDTGTDGLPQESGAKEAGPELMGSGGTRPIVPTEIRGRGMIQGVTRVSGEGVPSEVELRHVTEIDPNNPAKGGFERMFIERLLDSGISGKDAIGRTTTDASGRFKFKGLAPGLYEVRAQAASGAMGFASGMLPARGARVEVNVDIPAGDQTLKGRVLYANDKPFKGMVVASAGMAFQAAMMGQAGQVRPAYTDDDGRFELSGMPKGRYQISAIIPGELRVMGAPIDVPYTGEYELKILVGGVTVKGKVITAATEEVIAGATVFGGGGNPEANFSIFSTRSGADGRFEMTIPAGRGGGMFVRAEGYAPQMVEFRGGIDEEVVVTMEALGQLSGRVTQQDGGAPQKGVIVYITPQSQRGMGFGGGLLTAITDADGRYTCDGVQPGAVRVHALGGGWVSVGLSGFGFGEVKTPYVIELEAGGKAEQDLEVIASGKVQGRVLSADGRPVPGAVVQAGTPSDVRQMVAVMMAMGISFANAVTDGNGEFEIDAIVPGTQYALSAKAPEYPDAKSTPFTAASGKTETVDVTFPKSRWLDVHVVASGGTPISGAMVMAVPKRDGRGMNMDFSDLFGGGAKWTTDGAGKARVGPLPEGEFAIAAKAAGYIQASEDVGANDEGTVTIELQQGLVIAGRLVLPEGVPAQSVRVRVQRENRGDGEWFYERAPVDGDGRFRIDTIKESGEYKLSGSGRWEDRVFSGSVVADAGDEDVVLEITASTEEKRESVEVQVVDADGKPVPSGRITLTTFSDKGNSRSSSSTRINSGKAVFRGFNADGELWVEVVDLVGSARGATIQGPLTITGGKIQIRLPRPQVIEGTVKGPDGRGVAGVRISARPVHPRGEKVRSGREHAEAVSDGDGRFELKRLGPLEYQLSARAPTEYAPVAAQTVSAGTKSVVFTLRQGASAELTLLDAAGKPVAGASAYLRVPSEERGRLEGPLSSGANPTSDAKGVMALKGLAPGARFDVTVNPPHDRRDELRMIQLKGWAPTNETLTFARAYVISGQVRTTEGKIPTNVNVRWRKVGEQNWNWGGNVSAEGTYKLTQLEAGRYELKVAGGVESLATPRAPGEPAPPEPNIVTARAGATNVQLIVDLGATLRVKVEGITRTAERGRFTAHLRIESEQGGQFLHGRWDRSDEVNFRGLRPDATYTLWIGGLPGGKYVSQKGVRAQRTTLNVTPVQGGSITGVVKWPAEAGTMRHVNVNAYRQDGHGASTNVDLETGRFTITGLPEAEWTLAAHGWGEGTGSWQGQVKGAVGGEVEIVLKARK